MHLISSHQGRPPDDPVFSLHQEASQRMQRGDAIIDASLGVLLDDDGQLAVLPSAAQAVREVSAVDWAAYAPIAGTSEFLRAVVEDLLGSESEMARMAVAVATPGGSGAVRHAVSNFLEPHQALLASDWFWGPYRTICEETERSFDTFEMFSAGGFQALNVSALDAALGRLLASQGRALLVLNDPCHNPTGYSMTDDEWRAVVDCIAAHARRRPVTLLVDLAYFRYGARDPRTVLALLRPLVGRVTVLFAWSASKSFTHYGLRVGALVACVADDVERADVASALSYSSRGTWSNCNRGGLVAITRLLGDTELARTCAAERSELKALLLSRVGAFNRHAGQEGLSHTRYEGGFFVTLFDAHPRETAEALRAQGVYVLPQEGKSGGGMLRVALCAVPERDVPRLVRALARRKPPDF